MLVLTRRVGEVLRIGAEIKVTVLAVHGNQVRLGTDAPPQVQIWREELSLEKAGKDGARPKRRSDPGQA